VAFSFTNIFFPSENQLGLLTPCGFIQYCTVSVAKELKCVKTKGLKTIWIQ